MAQQMMPEQPARPADQVALRPADQVALRPADQVTSSFNDNATRTVLESRIISMNLSDGHRDLLIAHWIPIIADLQEQAPKYKHWHNVFVIVSGLAKVLFIILAAENFSLSGVWALADHIALLALSFLWGGSDLFEDKFHLSSKARLGEITEEMAGEVWKFLYLGASYENSQNEREAVGKLIDKLEALRRMGSLD